MRTYPVLIKLARIALRLSQKELADSAGIALRSVSRAEAASKRTKSLPALQLALEKKGVIFIDHDAMGGPGFRLPKEWVGLPDERKSSLDDQ